MNFELEPARIKMMNNGLMITLSSKWLERQPIEQSLQILITQIKRSRDHAIKNNTWR